MERQNSFFTELVASFYHSQPKLPCDGETGEPHKRTGCQFVTFCSMLDQFQKSCSLFSLIQTSSGCPTMLHFDIGVTCKCQNRNLRVSGFFFWGGGLEGMQCLDLAVLSAIKNSLKPAQPLPNGTHRVHECAVPSRTMDCKILHCVPVFHLVLKHRQKGGRVYISLADESCKRLAAAKNRFYCVFSAEGQSFKLKRKEKRPHFVSAKASASHVLCSHNDRVERDRVTTRPHCCSETRCSEPPGSAPDHHAANLKNYRGCLEVDGASILFHVNTDRDLVCLNSSEKTAIVFLFRSECARKA